MAQRWSSEEDDLLIEMMERVLKEHIWAQARSEPLLASRTSYGVQYHALMLVSALQQVGVTRDG